MINKLYDKIKTTLKENYKFIITFILFLIVCYIEFPFYIQSPGGIINIEDKVEVENGYKTTGTLNLSYVLEMKATIPTLLYAAINKDWDILKQEEMVYNNETVEQAEYRNSLLLEEANSNAIAVAYRYANKHIEILTEHLYITYVDESANTNVKIGDEILEIDGTKIINKYQIDDIISSKVLGSIINIKVKRNNEEITCFGEIQNIKNKKIVGISIAQINNIITDPNIKLNFDHSESGPSGGFMLALAIYNSLTEQDITQGRKIVGTGTIDLNGNIGSVGGIKYKIKGAVKEHADIFLVPAGENYEEAKEIIEENKYNIKLIEVNNFLEALDKLKL